MEIRRLTHLTNINNTVVRQYIIALAIQCRSNLTFIRTELENINELFSFQDDSYMTDWLTATKRSISTVPNIVIASLHTNRR